MRISDWSSDVCSSDLPDLPNHEPRGCPRGASYSWYLYSANRLKYPLVRGALLRMLREARKTMSPVDAWASIVEDPAKTRKYKTRRGMGGFAREHWDEANEISAASNQKTMKQYCPERGIASPPCLASPLIYHPPRPHSPTHHGVSRLAF